MKVLVIPDIHLKPHIFDRADEILKKGLADTAVCLMDIPDDWDQQMNINLYKETYDRVIQFETDHPNTRWCWGNHDISYIWGKLETGYSAYAERTVIDGIGSLEKKIDKLADISHINFVQRIDNVLFSHGGLCEEFVLALNPPDTKDINQILEIVNNAPRNLMWGDLSPLWNRPQKNHLKPYQGDKYIQVVGHTLVRKIDTERGFISTDVYSTGSNGQPYGEPGMIVIDSVSKGYVFISDKQKL